MIFDVGVMHPNSPHLFSDLAELLTVIDYFGKTSLHKNDLAEVRNKNPVSSDEIDEEKGNELDEENIDEDNDIAIADSEKNEKREIQLENVWCQLEYRESTLREYYPFIVNGDEISLKENLSAPQRVYILLLACSRLRSFMANTGIAQRWAKFFTLVCKEAMHALVPAHGKVRIFDANSDDRKKYYGTNLKKALAILGRDLGVLGINQKEIDSCSTSGDAGFDLIATIEFPDGVTTNYGILGQCGAQEKGWPKKTLEAHALNLSAYFHMVFQHPSTMFTPVCYRQSNGDWVQNSATNAVVLFDRIRIMHLLEKGNKWEGLTQSKWFNEFETELNKFVPEP
ncbi:hypothetical protein QNX21_000366 [Cronobacter sakazakii]|nr:hypothetical protein [Cronobacter sakazakii]